MNSTPPLWSVNCWPNRIQEPYMVLKKHEGMALFDESFINYGNNKIQYCHHLWAMSCNCVLDSLLDMSFFVLGNAFSIDVAHPKSNYSLAFRSGNYKNPFPAFLKKLNTVYGSNRALPLCNSSIELTPVLCTVCCLEITGTVPNWRQ